MASVPVPVLLARLAHTLELADLHLRDENVDGARTCVDIARTQVADLQRVT